MKQQSSTLVRGCTLLLALLSSATALAQNVTPYAPSAFGNSGLTKDSK